MSYFSDDFVLRKTGESVLPLVIFRKVDSIYYITVSFQFYRDGIRHQLSFLFICAFPDLFDRNIDVNTDDRSQMIGGLACDVLRKAVCRGNGSRVFKKVFSRLRELVNARADIKDGLPV